MAENTAPEASTAGTRVDHPGAYGPDPKKVIKDAKHWVTVAGSHTVYFDRKPTNKQVVDAIGEAP